MFIDISNNNKPYAAKYMYLNESFLRNSQKSGTKYIVFTNILIPRLNT